ncbi:hypothetical protein Cni_G07060 [Canna indica]|uniref:Reverse transcriptase domain-containing protein n=1 Tax=Canna indica TaxID=4628 RepID=A0AAQ3Q766_9LILI|nr:hypothetical protein Cni_G07060 [Canna indica]
MNKIDRIVMGNGSVITEHDDILLAFSDFYCNLWSESTSISDNFIAQLHFGSIDHANANNLIVPFSLTEVWNVVKSLPNGKSPGLDDFTGEFYKYYWHLIFEDFMNCMHDFHQNNMLPRDWNKTVLSFIPKVRNSSGVGDFRPIALCNLSYRILSKCLANRLKCVLPKLVSYEQSAFIQGRSIHDNILLAQEIAHSMYASKCKNPYVMIKIDLAKVYDKVSWDSILTILKACNFPSVFINWINSCLSTVDFACLLNNKLSHFFGSKRGLSSKRGLRQGDPLSPYLGTSYRSAIIDNCCWYIWHARNLLVHEVRQHIPSILVTQILAFTEAYFSKMNPKGNSISKSILVKWNPPPFGFYKINCDASFIVDDGGLGVVVRSDNGYYSFVLSCYEIGNSALHLEAMAIKKCLTFALEQNFPYFHIETDSKIMVDVLNKKMEVPWEIDSIVADIFHLSM